MKREITICNSKSVLFITAVVLCAILLITIFVCMPDRLDGLSVLISETDGEEEIKCIELESGFYFFLPGYADPAQARIKLTTASSTRIDGQQLYDGMSCSVFQINTPYTIEYEAWGKKYHNHIMFVQSKGVATVYVDTQSKNMDYIHRHKGNSETGTVSFYTVDGGLAYFGKADSIKGRGNYTWMFNKKSYNLDLVENIDLFEMGAAARWVLLSNVSDPTQLRNKIVYDFADAVELSYSPQSEWVDLYLNGEYAGLYLLSERNEVHQERVDLAGMDSFLCSLEYEERLINEGEKYIKTDHGQIVKIHCSQNDIALSNVQNVIQSVENAILAEDGVDPITGKTYLELIDLDSWAKKYLIEEIFGNIDAGFLSQYFYFDDSGKVYAGPVWDYDLSIGNAAIPQLRETDALIANRHQVKQGMWTPWFYSLCTKQVFQQRMQQLYYSDFKPCLDQLIEDTVYQYTDAVCQAKEMNSLRWGLDKSEKYADAAYLASYLQKRMEFLERYWNNPDSFVLVQIDDGRDSNMISYVIEYGELFPELPNLENTENTVFLGWYDENTNKRIDSTQRVYENMKVCAKWSVDDNPIGKKMVKLIPIGIISVLFLLLLKKEFMNTKRNGLSK